MITKVFLSPKTTIEQRETMEKPPMNEDESPLKQHNEQAPMEDDMSKKVEDKSVEEIIRENDAEIAKLKDKL